MIDAEKMLINIPGHMKRDLAAYCRDRGIENMSELVRQAIAKYIYEDYGENTLTLQRLIAMDEKQDELRDMLDITMRYLKKMHVNTLAYHAEIEDRFREAAIQSAVRRHEKFLEAFKADLKNGTSFFKSAGLNRESVVS